MVDLNTLDLDSLFAELTRDGLARRLIALARDEDLGVEQGHGVSESIGDITSRVTIEEGRMGRATLVAREAGVLAGIRAVPMVVQALAPNVAMQGRAADGKPVEKGQAVAVLEGPLREILAAERTMLNLVSRLSGVASLTARFVGLVEGTKAKVLCTRKTTPGLRSLEKYAVRCGGGTLHRVGLYDAVLIKDNHLEGAGLGTAPEKLAAFVTAAAAKARALANEPPVPPERKGLRFVEVEVQTIEQLRAILKAGGCGADYVLLDNMTTAQLAEAVKLRDASGVKVGLEASGGVNEKTIRAIAETGVDRISVGALTHHAVSMDFALDVEAAG